MKKLLFALMAICLMATASSCKKCGYCRDISGNATSSAVCQSGSIVPGITSDYKQEKADCSRTNGTWIITN